VEIRGSTVTGSVVYGGRSTDGDANKNRVTITGGTGTILSVEGGYAYGDADANENIVHIDTVSIAGTVYGGFVNTGSGRANSNEVEVTNSTVTDNVTAGYARSGEANGNMLNASNSDFGNDVRGGFVYADGDANDNQVSINGGSVDHTVLGGHVNGDGNANNNQVSINSSSVNDDVLGGFVTVDGNANDNQVSINGGSVGAVVHGGVVNGDGDANNNRVSVNGGSVTYDVHGGRVSGVGNANNNQVSINGGQVGDYVYGGYVANDGNANNNSVSINGGSVGTAVSGGYVSGDGNAIHNTVTVSGNPDLTGANLYGGYVSNTGDAFTGNTLNFNTSGLTVANLRNFQYLNFYLPTTLGNGGTALTVTGMADITGSIVNVGIDGANSPLARGDTITLIDAATLSGAPVNTTANGSGIQGVSLSYEFDITAPVGSNQLLATVARVGLNPQTKALAEGFLGGVAFTRQGADLAAEQGIAQALASTRRANGTGLQVFGAITYSDARYKTGSHVNVDGYNFLTGVSGAQNLSAGRLTLGGFFEAGDGDYDTHNSFATRASVKGKGDTKYYGLGVLGRFDLENNFYAEASLRAGRLENDFHATLSNRYVKYDTRSHYTSLHGGVGYVWKLSAQSDLDVYGKYLWTRVAGDSDRLTTGDPVKFAAVNSQRLRFGARFSNAMSNTASYYVGAAYEHEFDGEADAKVYGYKIKSPDLKGGTGIGEVGFTVRPSGNQNFSLDIGLQGYAGKRQGATGSVQAKYQF
jgi:outer membrane autotransporter protein